MSGPRPMRTARGPLSNSTAVGATLRMTIKDHHATCDGCPPSAPAITPVTSEWFKHWTRIEMQSGEEAHLCTECQKKQERGWLARDFVLECISCGCNTVDNPEVLKWHSTPAPPDSGKQSLSVCADCFDADPDRFRRSHPV